MSSPNKSPIVWIVPDGTGFQIQVSKERDPWSSSLVTVAYATSWAAARSAALLMLGDFNGTVMFFDGKTFFISL